MDVDVLIDHPDSTGTDADSKIAEDIKAQHIECHKWDINIIGIENGYVCRSIPMKGNSDAVNNALYQTYDLHEQVHENPIVGNLQRNILLAIVRCVREILKSVKKAENYKTEIRPALLSTFADRVEALKKVNYRHLHGETIEVQLKTLKRVTFRLGQTLSLVRGIEIYTKDSFRALHPDLATIVDRKALPCDGLLIERINDFYTILKAIDIRQTGPTEIAWGDFNADYKTEL